MMTVGQHDRAWLDVMEKQVPNGVGFVRQIGEQLITQNYLTALSIMRDNLDLLGMTKEEWAADFKKITEMKLNFVWKKNES